MEVWETRCSGFPYLSRSNWTCTWLTYLICTVVNITFDIDSTTMISCATIVNYTFIVSYTTLVDCSSIVSGIDTATEQQVEGIAVNHVSFENNLFNFHKT